MNKINQNPYITVAERVQARRLITVIGAVVVRSMLLPRATMPFRLGINYLNRLYFSHNFFWTDFSNRTYTDK